MATPTVDTPTRGDFWLSHARVLASDIGIAPTDDDDMRLRKTLLVSITLANLLAGLLWGLLYLAFREPLAASIPLSYAVCGVLNLIIFAQTRGYRLFVSVQIALILLLPWLLMMVLGGFINASAVILWSLLAPIEALLFLEAPQATRWFAAYAVLVIVSGLLESHLRTTNNLSPLVMRGFFVLNIVGVSGIAFAVLAYFITQRNAWQDRTDALLLNILPREVAAVLRKESRLIADEYDEASILFADIVDFTPMSANLTPQELVGLLDEVFSYFDNLVDRYDLEKIKTIGDCYMVAAGIPRRRPDHAHVLARMALEINAYVRQQTFARRFKPAFRIGINSGPVVAGVIGRKKFIYDLWGDAVNVAARMESHGESGKIQITQTTYELIKDDFICEPRGQVFVKGKGVMKTWYLLGPRPQSS